MHQSKMCAYINGDDVSSPTVAPNKSKSNTTATAHSFNGNKTKTSGSAYPMAQQRKTVCYILFYYSFSIFVLITTTTTFLSLVALAKCDRLPDGVEAAAISTAGSAAAPTITLTTWLGVNAMKIRARRNANVDYSSSSLSSHPFLKTTDVDDAVAGGGGNVGALTTAHDPSAAYDGYYRIKQQPQQFYRNQEQQVNGLKTKHDSDDLASLNLLANIGGEDICKAHCKCSRVKNAFTYVYCDFQANPHLNEEFGSNFRVPSDAISITIKLADKTHFSLRSGFFNKDNRVNSLTIEGAYSSGEQVEITTDAFQGNQGPYPDILIQDVYSVIVRSKAFAANGNFTVRHSNDVIIYPDAFEKAKINGHFLQINDLRIQEKAFNSAQAKLRIESSHIENIYRFEASLREIRFINCTIGTINNGTFDVIKINSIVFEGCRIDVIKARAITEKLYSEHVSITGATIGSIESEAIYGSGISELTLTKNKIDTIQANAIHVTAVNATIAYNNVKRLEKNWLRVKEWSNIIIEKNQFGEFGSMQLDETKHPVTCHFYSNHLTKPQPGSLNILNNYCYMHEILVNLPCRCNLDWLNALSTRDLRSEVYCTIDDKLGHCFNSTTFNMLKYLNEVCDDSKTTLDCVANKNLKKIDGRFFTAEELAADNRLLSKLLFIIGGCLILLLIIIILIFFTCRCLCRRNGKHTTPNAAQMPHVRNHLHEFSDAQLHIIEQTMQMLQKQYPEIQKQINARTQILLQQNLSDKKCVKTISQILDLLNMASHQSTDFIAFNQVLTQHLQPPPTPPQSQTQPQHHHQNQQQVPLPSAPINSTNTTDPIYSEPTLRDLDVDAGNDGFYTSSTIVPITPEGYMSRQQQQHQMLAAQTQLPEHIYAEPNCAQQPLLRNEYASPADRNIDALDVYTEPISDRVETNPLRDAWFNQQPQQQQQQQQLRPQRSAQYALPTTLGRNHNAPLTTSLDFPDVVSNQGTQGRHQTRLPIQATSTTIERPLTNVQRIAQDLQGMPKFQLNRPPQKNFHLFTPAVYTAPDLNRKKSIPVAVNVPQLATPERDEDLEMDMRGAAAMMPSTSAAAAANARRGQQMIDSSSDHSGGSNETVKIDDIIEYVDA